MELSSSSSSGSSKRAKAPAQVVVSCLVDGCNSDLSQCREYHRRHKVCEPHSKTPVVTIAGRHQRFCQQCSRFHSLEEFDEGKRSCRKRLDGHNRRRRKPQSDSLHRNTSGIFFSSPQGTRLLSFGGGPQVVANPATSTAWLGCVKAESDSSLLFNNNNNSAVPLNSFPISNSGHNSNSNSNSYREMNQFQFIQAHDQSNMVGAEANSSRMLFCNRAGAGNSSDRALSLLSSAPSGSQSRDMGSLQYGAGVGQLLFPPNYSQEMENKQGLVSDDGDSSGNTNTTLHFHSMFHDAPHPHDGSSPGAGGSASGSGGGPNQTLSFGW